MQKTTESFGEIVRNLRIEKGYSLRKFAQAVSLSPTYLSQIERGIIQPPGEEHITVMADRLAVPAEQLMALSGRVPGVVKEALSHHPVQAAALMELVSRLSGNDLERLIRHAEAMSTGMATQCCTFEEGGAGIIG